MRGCTAVRAVEPDLVFASRTKRASPFGQPEANPVVHAIPVDILRRGKGFRIAGISICNYGFDNGNGDVFYKCHFTLPPEATLCKNCLRMLPYWGQWPTKGQVNLWLGHYWK